MRAYRTHRPYIERLEGRTLLSSVYFLPTAQGDGSGSNFANAKAATAAAINAAWDSIAAGEVVYLGSGTYTNYTLTLDTSGTASARKTLQGVDTGSGLPLLQGDWVKFATSGRDGINISGSHIKVDGLRLQQYDRGVQFTGGANRTNLLLSNLTLTNMRDGFYIDGGANGVDGAGLSNLTISNCTVTNFEKRGFRLRDGVRDAQIKNSTADMGGSAWDGEAFGIGFEVGAVDADDAPNRNILFYNCVGKNAYDNAGSNYWNSDGFTAEGGNSGIVYQKCRAFDNTDGGFDVKTNGTIFLNCIAVGNKRNFRIWGDDIVMTNVLGAYSWWWPSGTAGGAGVWVSDNASNLTINNSTFHNNGINVQLANENANVSSTTLNNVILSFGSAKPTGTQISTGGNSLTQNNVAQWTTGVGPAGDPQYVNAESNTLYGNGSTDWAGTGNNFNSQAYTDKGYRDLPVGNAFSGTPITIASTGSTRIELEDYDLGGEGIAYHDSTADHKGSTYRNTEAVDTIGTPTGYGLGYLNGSEWLNYTINVPVAGVYTLTASVSTSSSNQKFTIRNGYGNTISGTVTFGPTSGYTTTMSVNLTLQQGPQQIQFRPGSSSFNIDYLTITAPSSGLAFSTEPIKKKARR
jgi:hypothetical protein